MPTESTTFQKGSIPWNKGMAGFIHSGSFKPGHAQSNTGRTHYKNGCIPWTKNQKETYVALKKRYQSGKRPPKIMPIGTITVRAKKNKPPYRFIKMGENRNWVPYSKYLWMMAGRKLKVGEFIHHIDGNSLNDNLDNYMAVTKRGHSRIHVLEK